MANEDLSMQIVLEAINNATPGFDELDSAVTALQDTIQSVIAPAQELAATMQTSFSEAGTAAEQLVASLDSGDSALTMWQDAMAGIFPETEEIASALTEWRSALTAVEEELNANVNALTVWQDALTATEEELAAVGEAATTAGAEAAVGMDEGKASVGEFEFSLEGLKSTIMGVGAVLIGGFGLFELTDNAFKAGSSVYDLSAKLHISGEEAERLNIIFDETGTSSQTAISTLTRLDKAIETAGAKGNATTKAFEEFGISLSQWKTDSAEDRLGLLSQAYKDAGDNANTFLSEVLGPRSTQLAPMLEQWADKAKEAGEIKLAGIDPEQMKEGSAQMALLEEQFKQLGYVIAIALEPLAKVMMPALQGLASAFEDAAKHANVLMPLLVAIGGALAPLTIVSTISKAMKEWTAIQEGLNVVLMGTEVSLGPIVIAAAAVAFVAYEVITHWTQVKTFFEGMWDDIKSLFGDAISRILGNNEQLIDGITESWSALKEIATDVWTVIKDVLSTAWEAIVAVANFIWDGLKDYWTIWGGVITSVFEGIWNQIEIIVKTALDVVVNTIAFVLDLIRGNWSGAWQDIKNIGEAIWNGIRDTFINIWDTISSTFIDWIEGIKAVFQEHFGDLATKAVEWGTNLIEGFIKGIDNAGTELKSKIESFGSNVISWVKDVLGIHSPSEYTQEMGVQLSQGLALGIANGTMYVQTAIEQQGTILGNYQSLVQKADDAINTYNQDMAANAQKYNSEVDAALNKQASDIAAATSSMATSLVDASNIFQDTEKKMVDPNALTQALQDQVTQLQKFTSDIADLTKKGVDEGLIANLEQMGPKAEPEITALNSMTSSQLEQYVTLWQEKQQAANNAVAEELKNAQSDIGSKVQKIRDDTNATLGKYYEDWQTANQKVLDNTQLKLEQVQTAFNNMSANATTDGQALIANFVEGIRSREADLQQEMANVAQIADDFMPHSPAKVGALSQLASYGPALVNGFVDGIKKSAGAINEAMSALLSPAANVAANLSGIGVSGGISMASSIATVTSSGGGGPTIQVNFNGMTIAQSQQALAQMVGQQIYQNMKTQGKF